MTGQERLLQVVALRRRLTRSKERMARFKEINAPQVLIDNEQKVMDSIVKELNEIEPK